MTIRAEQEITLTRVDDGEEGKSAYEAAIEGGLPSTVTEREFNEDLADVPELDERITTAETAIGNPSDPSSSSTLFGRIKKADTNITEIEDDITTLGGRVSTAESDITTIEGEIGDPEDQASASGSIYARVKNVKNIADQAAQDIEDEVERAQAAEQAASQAAANAQSSADAAGTAASTAQTAAEAAIEANYRKYNAVSWDATTIATKTAHGYSESWARSSAEGYYQGACNVGDVLLIYVTNTSVTPNTVHKLLVRVTTASVAGAPTTGDVISYSSNINAYFWHDNNGAHILSNTNGYRTDLSGNGMEVVNLDTGYAAAKFDDDSVEFYNSDNELVAQITTVSGNGQSLLLGDTSGDFAAESAGISVGGGCKISTGCYPWPDCAMYAYGPRPRSILHLAGGMIDADYRDDDNLASLCLNTYRMRAKKAPYYNFPAAHISNSSGDHYWYYDNQGNVQYIQNINDYIHGDILIDAGGSLPTGITNGVVDASISKHAKALFKIIRRNNAWVPVIKLYADECTFNDNAIVTTDDSRLSNARTPLSHTHTKSEVTDFAHTHQVSDIVNPYLAGEIKMYAGTTVPTGWLLCDGSTFSSEDYPNLAAALGDSWGEHSGTTYYLPNLNGRTPVGYDANDTDFDAVGETGGAKGAWKHNHTQDVHNHYAGVYTVIDRFGSGTRDAAGQYTGYGNAIYTDTKQPAISASGSDNNDGTSATPVDVDKANMPPYAVVKYIICAY